jgi:hypothetical protein
VARRAKASEPPAAQPRSAQGLPARFDTIFDSPCIVVGATLMSRARRSSYIKVIKRQMFGRARFDLLRKRVLLAN